jgi:hypothetical protein
MGTSSQNDTYRRLLGWIIGLMVGLLYGLVSEYLNFFVLPGIPLYQSPPGALVSVALIGLGGCLMGLIAAWPDEPLPGIGLSAVAITFLVYLVALIKSGQGILTYLPFHLYIFLPTAVFYLPAAALIRWTAGMWEAAEPGYFFSIRKPVLMLILVITLPLIAGSLSLYPSEVRVAFRTMDGLVQKGMLSSSVDDIPRPLKAVDGFMQEAHGPYTLQWIDNPDLFPALRPSVPYTEMEVLMIVRFEAGLRFMCLFTAAYSQPIFSNY